MTQKGLRLRKDGDMVEIEIYSDRSAIVRVIQQESGSVRAILTARHIDALVEFLTEKSVPPPHLPSIERY